MTPVFRGRIVVALVAAFAFAGAANANAAIITSHDDQGRTITFDVRAATVDTEWYASVLRASAHGNEISAVRIIIVPEPQIQAFCGGADAAACYDRTSATIVLPAGKSKLLETVILHEYGHHLDTYWRVPGVQELNGTPVWWAARGMAALLAEPTGRVRLLARLEPQRRRGVRRGLRVHPRPQPLRDDVVADPPDAALRVGDVRRARHADRATPVCARGTADPQPERDARAARRLQRSLRAPRARVAA